MSAITTPENPTWYIETRSQWHKSLKWFTRQVFDGRMSAASFAAACRPSPDPRDPSPEKLISGLEDLAASGVRARAAAVEAAARTEQARREHDAWLTANLHTTGFALIAGEDSEVIARGSLDECRSSLHRTRKCRRDGYSGRGAWVIVFGPTSQEVESGFFDKNGAF